MAQMKKLTIGLATRGRPGLPSRTIGETLKHITLPDTKLVFLVDEDDTGTLSLRNKPSDPVNDPRVIWSIEPRPDALGTKYNRMMRVAPADAYLVMVDYAPHMTPGFDANVLDAASVYSDGYAIILNFYANLSFSQINAVTHKMAEKMGGIYCEFFPYWFVDHWLEEIAKRTGRGVFANVFIDCSRKQETIGYRDPAFWGAVFQYLRPEREAIVDSILNAPDFKHDLAEYKEAMRRNGTSIDHWSYLINSSLGDAQAPPGDLSDPAYKRLVEAACAIVKPRQAAMQAELAQKKAA
jgi:hypothetical protein